MNKTNTNYPLWRSDYPCSQSVKETTALGTQYFCALNGKICGAFVLNDTPGGAYEKHGFTFAGEKDLERGIADIPTFSLYELNF